MLIISWSCKMLQLINFSWHIGGWYDIGRRSFCDATILFHILDSFLFWWFFIVKNSRLDCHLHCTYGWNWLRWYLSIICRLASYSSIACGIYLINNAATASAKLIRLIPLLWNNWQYWIHAIFLWVLCIVSSAR